MRLFFPKEFSKDPDFRTPAVAHEVPIATVRDGLYVLTDGSLSAVWRVRGIEDELAGGREVSGFYGRLQQVLNSMPPGMQFKLLHRIHHNYRDLLDEHEAALDGTNPFARYVAWDQSQSFRRAMEQGRILRSDNLVVLTYNPRINWWRAPGGVGAKLGAFVEDMARGANRGPHQQMLARYQQALAKFDGLTRQVVHQMELARLEPNRLDEGELYELAWKILNPRESMRRECPPVVRPDPRDPYAGMFATPQGRKAAARHPQITVVAPQSEREQLCVSDWHVGEKWMRIDDLYYAAVTLRRLPTATRPGIGRALASLGFECTVSVDAVMQVKASELARQWTEARSAKSKAAATLIPGTEGNPLDREMAQEKEAGLMALSEANENPFLFRITVLVAAPNPTVLEERVDVIISAIREMGQAEAVREHYGVREAVRATWPFSPVTQGNFRKTLTTHVANMMPLVSRWEGSKRAVTLFLDPSYRLVKHDPFPVNQPNKNRTICGKSGSGKSFATQLADVQPHAARSKTEVLIVESGGSFELTTKCFGGVYLKLGPSCPYQINAFDLPPGFENMTPEDQEAELGYKFKFIKNLVMTMARLTDPEQQMLAENVVGTVCQQTYQSVPRPKLRDFYRLLGEYKNPGDPGAVSLAGRLRTRLANYVVDGEGRPGIYSKYFDCDSNFDVRSNIICFDLMDVKDDPSLLNPMAMLVILGLIYNRLMLRDGTERLIIIDEAWALIKEQQGGGESPAGQGIELFWREGRKLNGASAMISQNISDMMGDKIGRAVIGNSQIQYFLVHEPLKANTDAFLASDFSPEKIERVYNLTTKYGDYSEIMVREGAAWGVVRLPSAGVKYWLATTDPKDLDVRREYFKTFQQRFGMSDEVVVAILAEDYPAGVHGVQRKRMSTDEALRFAEWWQMKYREFAGHIARTGRVPAGFRMDYLGAGR